MTEKNKLIRHLIFLLLEIFFSLLLNDLFVLHLYQIDYSSMTGINNSMVVLIVYMILLTPILFLSAYDFRPIFLAIPLKIKRIVIILITYTLVLIFPFSFFSFLLTNNLPGMIFMGSKESIFLMMLIYFSLLMILGTFLFICYMSILFFVFLYKEYINVVEWDNDKVFAIILGLHFDILVVFLFYFIATRGFP